MVQKLIRFFGLGPQRSGSTWLDVCLRQHPQCALPVKTKETFFYDRHFADSNILCLKHESIHKDPVAHIDRLLHFINVATEFHPQSLHSIVNASEVPRSRLLSACATSVTRKLRHVGLHDIVNVAKLLGFYSIVYRSGVRPPLQMTLDQRNRVRSYYERDVRL